MLCAATQLAGSSNYAGPLEVAVTVYFLQRRDHTLRIALQVARDRGVRLNL